MNEEFKQDIVCRSCIESSDNMRSIFQFDNVIDVDDNNCQLSNVLTYCTNLEIDENDGLPNKLCNKCIKTLIQSYKFKQQFIRADSILRQKLLNNKKVKLKSAFEEVIIKQEINDEKTDIGNSILDGEKLVEIEINSDSNSVNEDPVGNESVMDKDEQNLNENSLSSDHSFSPPEILKKSKNRTRKRKQENSMEIINCNICKKTLQNSYSLKRHMLVHSDCKPFLCNECGSCFKTKYQYDSHMTTHYPNLHKCDICNKVYKQARSLRDHKRLHGEEAMKSFLCGICGKELSRSYGLQKHMLIHTNQKPHKCEICGKHFRNLSNFIVHKQRHKGIKPYSCTECDLRFTESTHLKRHFLIHTGEKPYKCDLCEKRFNRRSNLTVHKRTHTGEKIHVCKICDEGFTQNSYLRAHMVVHDKT